MVASDAGERSWSDEREDGEGKRQGKSSLISFNEEGAAAKPSDGVIFLPYMSGENPNRS